ncbi:uncharacterized protein LOC106652865 [Trichogramma pretiosum]|uniref:uncharacterized protein LOC106652865 n=1 Tax=Trichogramma pretiosum TaxID=7493 RepID=UPI0006C99175|nr:uncharacterized protein LOC106652865 [Trichogramma pretiosum]
MILFIIMSILIQSFAYDPEDESLKNILLPQGHFEAFYLKGYEDDVARPPHLHGSFHKYKNPALINAPNSAAYGFRFDGKRRFNYD